MGKFGKVLEIDLEESVTYQKAKNPLITDFSFA